MNETPKKFSWINIYKEIAVKLIEFKDKQHELISLLKQMISDGIVCMSIKDKDENDQEVDMSEIDPFTFFANFNRGITSNNRIAVLTYIKKAWNLKSDIPVNFEGIPVVNNMKVWFVTWKKDRGTDDVKILWDLFIQAIKDNIEESTFNQVLKIKNVNWNLTMGLYWLNPDKYLNLDKVNREYLKNNGIKITTTLNYNNYFEYIEIVNDKFTNKPFYEISYNAWKQSILDKKINYWIFQGNPKIYDVIQAIKDNMIKTWWVKSHKTKIKIGDKVILWTTGENPGCYALCEITSEVYEDFDDDDQDKYYVEKYFETRARVKSSRARLKITHSFIQNPIYYDQIRDIKVFENFKAGIQGTTFSATKEQYEEIIKMGGIVEPSNRKFWIYAPGENAEKWDSFYSKGIMAIGWDKLGDLNNFESREQIQKELKDKYKYNKEPSNRSLACFEFCKTIKKGDIIISKRGKTEYLGYGIVESDYYFDESTDNYKSQRKVKWIKKGIWKEKSGPIVLKTLTNITKYPDYVEKLKKLIGIEIEEKKPIMKYPLNQILYGPPGTGKTFKLKDYFPNFTSKEKLQTKEEYLESIVTDISWWEVIAVVLMDLGKSKVLDILNHPLLQAKNRTSATKTPKNTIWAQLQMRTKMDCPNVNLSNRLEPGVFYKDKNSVWTIDNEIVKNELPELIEILNKHKNFNPEQKINKRYEFITFHQSYSYEEFIEGLKPKKSEDETQSDNIIYEIVPGVFKRIADKAKKDPENNYALFIDEINRGNISKIFGELITLIEEDKRAGNENEMTVTLPYSGEQFSVPNNLYIIGTMNTADRSIAMIDTALRRRFEFKEMMPRIDLLNGVMIDGIKIDRLLEEINKRIEFLYDRDHTIGHSYFLELKKNGTYRYLCDIFINKIIPLLQEYFFDDWEKIQIVLGDQIRQFNDKGGKESVAFDDEINKYRFIQNIIFEEKKVLGFDHEDYEDLLTYIVNPELETGTISPYVFKKIYDKGIYKEINLKPENKEEIE